MSIHQQQLENKLELCRSTLSLAFCEACAQFERNVAEWLLVYSKQIGLPIDICAFDHKAFRDTLQNYTHNKNQFYTLLWLAELKPNAYKLEMSNGELKTQII